MIQITIPEGADYAQVAAAYGLPETALRGVNPGSGELAQGQTINLPIQNDMLQGSGFSYQDDAVLEMDRVQRAEQAPIGVLDSYGSDVPMNVMERPDEIPAGFPEPVTFEPGPTEEQYNMLSDEQGRDNYLKTIKTIETGGIEDPFIRTRANGSGSSAYGPYQVTMGLANEYINKHPEIFLQDELQALTDVRDRQDVSLVVGGADRAKYSRGGEKELEGKQLAAQFGYDDVEAFLTDFDYGGNLGYTGDKGALVKAQEKMALKVYADNSADGAVSAAEWHGGKGWKTSPSLPQTQDYIQKYNKLQG